MDEFMKVVTQNYANFEGRARRREYWIYTLVYMIIQFVLGIIAGLLGGRGDSPSALGSVFVGLSGLLSLALFVPTIAVTARRLHDTGRSGWLQLLSLIPLVGSLILLYFTIQDSQPGSNKWGPNPKGEGVGAVTAQNW